MSWKTETIKLISHFQALDVYAKYAELDEFLQWASAEGHAQVANCISESANNRNGCMQELLRWRKDHVSPWILFIYGHDFASAGSSLLRSHKEDNTKPPGSVVYFLYGRSIELFLKAFLVARGITAGSARTYKHNLAELLIEARRRKLGRFVPLEASEILAVKVLSTSYADKQIEYPVLGGQQRPKIQTIANVAQKLDIGLHQFCREKTARK